MFEIFGWCNKSADTHRKSRPLVENNKVIGKRKPREREIKLQNPAKLRIQIFELNLFDWLTVVYVRMWIITCMWLENLLGNTCKTDGKFVGLQVLLLI